MNEYEDLLMEVKATISKEMPYEFSVAVIKALDHLLHMATEKGRLDSLKQVREIFSLTRIA